MRAIRDGEGRIVKNFLPIETDGSYVIVRFEPITCHVCGENCVRSELYDGSLLERCPHCGYHVRYRQTKIAEYGVLPQDILALRHGLAEGCPECEEACEFASHYLLRENKAIVKGGV